MRILISNPKYRILIKYFSNGDKKII